jgi:hypothetical protein
MQLPADSDDDKLLYAVLNEIRMEMKGRIAKEKKEFTVSFTPAQAFAIRILAFDYEIRKTSYLGNAIHKMANEVHKFYQ